jgi:hypothetical protein
LIIVPAMYLIMDDLGVTRASQKLTGRNPKKPALASS